MLVVAQIIVAIILIILVLLQERSSGSSAIFGGAGTPYHTRRGLEKWIYTATLVAAGVFAALAILKLVLKI
jgi:preprotein translocase subunit SecG